MLTQLKNINKILKPQIFNKFSDQRFNGKKMSDVRIEIRTILKKISSKTFLNKISSILNKISRSYRNKGSQN